MKKAEFYVMARKDGCVQAVKISGYEDDFGWRYNHVERPNIWHLIEPNTGLVVASGKTLKSIRQDVWRMKVPENLQNLSARVKDFLQSKHGQAAIQDYKNAVDKAQETACP